VVIAPRGWVGGPIRTIACGLDGGAESWTALDAAGRLAAQLGASVELFGVVGPVPFARYSPDYERRIAEAVRAAVSDALRDGLGRLGGHGVSMLLEGEPAPEIARACEEEDVDLLVLGSRGYGPIRSVLLGSVSRALVHSAPCPVMVVPRSASSGAVEPVHAINVATPT
jgi:nucleotide-binding universal stress UspA family protein